MAVNLEAVYADAMSLPDDAKENLVERLVADLAAAFDPELQQVHIANAMRRRDAMRSGAVRPIPGDEVLRQAREALSE